jgi:glycosyltransferase involved in cell wall biosynthesis
MLAFGYVIFGVALFSLAWVYWNIRAWPRIELQAPTTNKPDSVRQSQPAGSVSVIIPARDEEHNLPALLESLMKQGPEVLEVIVLDDHSTDDTSGVVLKYAKLDPRIKLLRGLPLPPGWFGKTWAGYQLAQVAQGEWLLSMDADTKLEPGAVSSILAAASQWRVTYLSCWPRFELVTLTEKIFLPMLNFVTFTTFSWAIMFWRMFDPQAIISSGACMLMHRKAYDRIGGHANAGIRNGLLEDHALARGFRQHGERALCLDGHDILSVRMYRSASEILGGFRKNLFKALRDPLRFWGFILVQTTIFLLPFVLAPLTALLHLPSLPFWLAAACVVAGRLLLSARFRMSWASAFLHPVAMAGMLYCALQSWWCIVTGRGVTWKGRRYFTSPQQQPQTAPAPVRTHQQVRPLILPD